MAALFLHGNCRRLFNVGAKMQSPSTTLAVNLWERRSRLGMLGLSLCACALLFGVAALAQQRASGNPSVPSSDLASDNQERVAASEAQIVTVLGGNSGLLVELKRWVAKDAADHGQVVEDADLDDTGDFYAAFARPEVPRRCYSDFATLRLLASETES